MRKISARRRPGLGQFCLAGLIGAAGLAAAPRAALGQAKAANAMLDTVVVTADRREETLREVTGSVTVITSESVKNSSAATMSEILRQQGFQVSGYNAGGKTVTIRGMNQTQGGNDLNSAVLILLNGRRFGGPTLEYIGLANVERIEIIRGPAAVQYGPAGMGGVVNIVTKRGGEKLEVRAEAGAGSYDLERFKAAVSGQSATGLLDFSLGATQQYQGDYKTGKGWTWPHTRTGNSLGLNADLGVNFYDRHRASVNFNAFQRPKIEGGLGASPCMGGLSHHNPEPPTSGSTCTFGVHDIANTNTALAYEGASADETLKWLTRFSFGKHRDGYKSYRTSGGAPTYWSKSQVDNQNLTAALSYDVDRWSLSGGLDYIAYDTENASGYGLTQAEYRDAAVFAAGKLRFWDDALILSAGGRFDIFKVTDVIGGGRREKSHFSPSVGLAWLPVDWLKLRTNYSIGFRMPDINAMLPQSPQMLSNPDLKPETSRTWEVGADAAWEFITASLTYFHSEWNDKIFSNVAPGTCYNTSGNPAPCNRYINIQGATIAGWELGFSADLGQALKRDFTLKPYLNLTWLPTVRNNDHTPGSSRSVEVLGFDTLTDVNRLTASYGVNFFEPDLGLTVNLNASYAGEKITRNWQDFPYPNNPWEKWTPGTIVDLMAEKEIGEFAGQGRLKARVEVNNLFDRYDEAYYHYPGPGRNFYAGLVYEY